MKAIVKMVLVGAAILGSSAAILHAGEKAVDKWAPPAAKPPSYPAPQKMPINAALADSARSELIQDQNAQDAFLRAHAIEAWKEIGDKDAATVAGVKGLLDPAAVVRFAACMTLGEVRAVKTHDQVFKLIDDKDRNVQVAVRYAQHRMGDRRHSHDLEKFAMDWDKSVRANTVMVLGLLNEPSALKILKHMTGDKSAAVVMQVAEARWRLGDIDGLADLISGSVSQHPDEQISAYLAMAGPRDQRVIEHVRGGLTGEYAEVKLAAARAMGMLGSDEGYGIAMHSVKAADPRQRALTALAFGSIGRSDAQPYLSELLKDKDDEVRLAAATGILQLH